MDTHSDNDLIELIRKDDKSAFRVLHNRHYKVLLGTAINILRDQEQVKDVVQEVFLRIWQNREGLNIHSNVAAYLKRAVINRSLNQLKAQKPFVEEEQLADESGKLVSALVELAFQELKTALEGALNLLPERCRLVFVMKRLEGLSQKEIAAMLNISTKTVENQITKAMKVMTHALNRYRKKG